MRIISAIWSSWLHSQLWEPLWQGLFSSVRYYGHSGSQEIGHLKLVVFAGEWLFEEFLRANGAYRGFFLKKPFTINTVGFTTVCSSKSHMPPLQWIFPLCAPHLTFSPCVPPSEFFTVLMVYGFLRSPQRKNPLYARLLAKTPQKATLPQKPPIWGDPIPPGLNAKAKKDLSPRCLLKELVILLFWGLIQIYISFATKYSFRDRAPTKICFKDGRVKQPKSQVLKHENRFISTTRCSLEED